MKKLLILLLCYFTGMSSIAQSITHKYNNVSISDALQSISKVSKDYIINFVYNDLEDFKVTTDIRNKSIPTAIRQMIGFYPIGMKITKGGTDIKGQPLPDMIFVEYLQKEDRKITGKILDEHGQTMEFVNVSILQPKDSSFINGGVTTETGDFVIPCNQTNVLLKISYIGYRTLYRHFASARVGNISMIPDAYRIKGVTVKGHHKVEMVDRSVYTFSEEQLKNSNQAQQLIATLPGLRIDRMRNTLATLSGKSLKILINGIEASDNDLKMLKPKEIKNVEYYTVPPARYADAGTLINIHTRKADDGYAAGVDVMQGFKDGFNNSAIFAKYNHGNSQFSFDYNFSWRNVPNCDTQHYYSFMDNGNKTNYNYKGKYDFGYTTQDFNLKYLYSRDDSLNFQAKFTPSIFSWFNNSHNNISAENNLKWKSGWNEQKRHQNSFSPSIDLYFDKKLSHGQELTTDIVGTWFHNRESNNNQQYEEQEQVLDDNMRQHNNKHSLIGELAYSKEWKKAKLSLGYKATLAKSDFKISNVLSDYQEYQYHATDDKHYAYAQLNGSILKMGYRLSMGGTYVHSSNDDTHYNKWYFTPTAEFSYPMKNGILRLEGNINTDIPSIADLSNNSTVTIPGLYRHGNPYLKSALNKNMKLSYSLNTPYINMDVNFGLSKTDDAISNYYQWQELNGDRVIVSRPENCDYMLDYGFKGTFQIRPFKSDLLVFSLETGYLWQKEKSEIIGTHHYHYLPLDWTVDFRKGNWGAEYYQRIPSKILRGTNIDSEENTQNIYLYYQHKQLHIGLYMLFPFIAAKYTSDILSNEVLDYHSMSKVTEQAHTIGLHISYNIFSGKQKELRKKIDNKDRDQGFF
jgi:hypothetical protein